MKRAMGACALILALAVSFVAPASAAQLVLAGGQHPSNFSSARCDGAVGATTPPTATTANSVQLSGIDVACAGQTIAVKLYDSTTATTVTGTATAPAAGGSASATLSGAYTPAASVLISVTIASWPIPTTWAYTAVSPATGCVILNPGVTVPAPTCSLAFGANTDLSGTSWNVKVTVSTTSTSWVSWRATVDFADVAKFPFLARYVGEYSGNAAFGQLPGGFCSGSTRVVTFTGVVQRNTDGVRAGTSRSFDFVGNSTGQITNPVYSCP